MSAVKECSRTSVTSLYRYTVAGYLSFEFGCKTTFEGIAFNPKLTEIKADEIVHFRENWLKMEHPARLPGTESHNVCGSSAGANWMIMRSAPGENRKLEDLCGSLV